MSQSSYTAVPNLTAIRSASIERIYRRAGEIRKRFAVGDGQAEEYQQAAAEAREILEIIASGQTPTAATFPLIETNAAIDGRTLADQAAATMQLAVLYANALAAVAKIRREAQARIRTAATFQEITAEVEAFPEPEAFIASNPSFAPLLPQ